MVITHHIFYEKEGSEKVKVKIPYSVLHWPLLACPHTGLCFLNLTQQHSSFGWLSFEEKEIYSPLQWHMYVAEKEHIKICQALQGGEYQIGSYFLDVYAVRDGMPTAFEFNGCFSHSCIKCYYENDQNPLAGTTFAYLYYTTQQKRDYLKRAGFHIRSIWEHEWATMTKSDGKLAQFLARTKLPTLLVLRDVLVGGRTNTIYPYYKAAPNEKIDFYDFTSLSPFIIETKQ